MNQAVNNSHYDRVLQRIRTEIPKLDGGEELVGEIMRGIEPVSESKREVKLWKTILWLSNVAAVIVLCLFLVETLSLEHVDEDVRNSLTQTIFVPEILDGKEVSMTNRVRFLFNEKNEQAKRKESFNETVWNAFYGTNAN